MKHASISAEKFFELHTLILKGQKFWYKT